MLKKALIATAVLAATSGVAFANGGTYVSAPIDTHEGGFYLGAAISRDVGNFQVNRNFVVRETSPFFPGETDELRVHTHWDQGLGGVNGEIFGGYGMLFQDHWYLAAEIFGSVSSLKGEHNEELSSLTFLDGTLTDTTLFVNHHLDFKVNHTFGISLLPGVKVTDSTLLYGRIGYVNSRFKVNEHADGRFFDLFGPPGVEHVSFDIDHSKNEGGLQLGIGLETMITNNCSIRGEYDYNQYGRFSDSVVFFDDVPNGEHVFSDQSVKPKIDQFKLAAIYHFYA